MKDWFQNFKKNSSQNMLESEQYLHFNKQQCISQLFTIYTNHNSQDETKLLVIRFQLTTQSYKYCLLITQIILV